MKIPRLFLSVAIAAAFSATLLAQQAPSGLHRVACIKIKPGKFTEFSKWMATDGHALLQARVDSGEIASGMLVRSVIPEGKSAECDYLVVSMYAGAPPKPSGLDGLAAMLKKAGLSMSAQEYVDHRDSLTELISNNLFQNRISVGTMKKGDYLVVNYFKVPDMGDELRWEKEVWQPLAESMVQAGVLGGWSVNAQVLPGGTDLPYQSVTVDTYPSWDAVMTGRSHIPEHFHKVHPNMEMGAAMERGNKVHNQLSVQLLTVVDMVGQPK